MVRFRQLTVGPFQENTYLVLDEEQGEGVLIDPGDEGYRIISMINELGCRLSAIWLTHAHLDHIGAIAAVKRSWDVPVHMHEADLPLYRAADRQAAAYGLPLDPPPEPDKRLADGDVLSVGSLRFRVLHTPGHSPGHVVFSGEGVLFAGDLLFRGSIGRTDLPLSDPAQMVRSLDHIGKLPPELGVHPGHGPATTIGEELSSNPFLNGMARVLGG